MALCIDTAHSSGWAWRSSPVAGFPFLASGVCNGRSFDGPMEVIYKAKAAADACGIPHERIVLVLEKPLTHHRARNVANTSFGLGKSHGVWRACWEQHGLSARRIATCTPRDWRKAVLGTDKNDVLPLAQLEQARAQRILGTKAAIPADEAAALCISEWALRAPVVLNKVPKRIVKRKVAYGAL